VFNRKFTAVGASFAAVALVMLTATGAPVGATIKAHVSALQTKAENLVTTYETAPPTSAYPDYHGKAYNPGHHTAWVVACGASTPTCLEDAQFGVQALKAMGWKTPALLDGGNSASTQAAILERAAQQKISGVMLIGVDVNSLPAATEAAVKAHVKIVCVVCNSGPRWKGKVIDVTPNWVKAGDMAAWETIALSGDHAQVAQFYDPEFSAVILRDQGVTDTLTLNCPNCSITNINVVASEFGTPGPAPYLAFLNTHPAGTVNDVIAQADFLMSTLVATDASAGRSDINIGGWDGDAPNVTALAANTPGGWAWTVAHPYDYEAWAAADVLGRWTAGKPIPSGLQNMPLMIVTPANAKSLQSGNPLPSTYPAPGSNGSWQKVFKSTWK
jgi:ABC-type sugar transport system substrate-binding protein